jgi:hypothetical protein
MPRFFSPNLRPLPPVRPMRRIAARCLLWSLLVILLETPAWHMSPRLSASEGDRRDRAESPQLRAIRLTLRARQALATDHLLAPYNLCAVVRDESVTLQGTLPTTALALRAQERLQNLSLFTSVRSELLVDPNCDLAAELPISSSTLTVIPGGKPRIAGALMRHNGSPIPIPVMKFGSGGGSTSASSPASVDPSAPPTNEKTPLSDAVSLMPPRPIPALGSKPAEPAAEILTPRLIPAANEVSSAVEKIRQSQTRFQSLQVSVRDGIVTIRGSGDDVFAFAQAVRIAPGVVRVVVNPN